VRSERVRDNREKKKREEKKQRKDRLKHKVFRRVLMKTAVIKLQTRGREKRKRKDTDLNQVFRGKSADENSSHQTVDERKREKKKKKKKRYRLRKKKKKKNTKDTDLSIKYSEESVPTKTAVTEPRTQGRERPASSNAWYVSSNSILCWVHFCCFSCIDVKNSASNQSRSPLKKNKC
jgi:hypothetical protein